MRELNGLVSRLLLICLASLTTNMVGIRKRPLNAMKDISGDQEDMRLSSKNHTSPKKRTMTSAPSIRCLRLEAIFHPKFENEKRENQDIRDQMKEKVKENQGCLEVSLKHSGSLLLWSGSQRYYSKNSTANCFTYVGEMLLRQHFMRAWYAGEETNDAKGEMTNSTITGDKMYKNCSDFVETNRLTLSFEVVTFVLGHHGDLPKRDFVILTAVADKMNGRFYTTSELIELSQRYRLPHNDFWLYTEPHSVDQLFRMYDKSRETGKAKDIIQELNRTSNAYIPSMYPHEIFQGDILEGFVIRFITIDHQSDHAGLLDEKLQHLASVSREILAAVPPTLPPCFTLHSAAAAIYSTDVREVFRKCINDGFSDLSKRLGDDVYEILNNADSLRRMVEKASNDRWDIKAIASDILNEDSADIETKRIARLIQKADQLNLAMKFGLFRENDSKWICIINILQDKSFLKYQRAMERDDMHLFRGFSIAMETNEKLETESNGNVHLAESSLADVAADRDSQLILKMKLLPYMVRTFCCRNGLKIIEQGGPDQFASYSHGLLSQWRISGRAQAKWLPYLKAWGYYAKAVMTGATKGFIDYSLPPLTESFYLDHLNHFDTLYERGKIQLEVEKEFSASKYHAIALVLSTSNDVAFKAASKISEAFGGVRTKKIEDIEDLDCISAKAEVGGGLICYGDVSCKTKNLKRIKDKAADLMSLVLVGCDETTIDSLCFPNPKKIKGLSRSWKSFKCASVLEVSTEILNGNDEHVNSFNELVSQLLSVSESVDVIDSRPGLLLFFPTIPGFGKSALSNQLPRHQIEQAIAPSNSGKGRRLRVLVGDEVKGKYWHEVKTSRLEESSSIFIADKNAPVSAWGTVAESVGRGMAVPIIPDDEAFCTTVVQGLQKVSGDFDADANHVYPFSLSYLALCLARVMSRTPKSHKGKLDSSNPGACMIVVKFFCLYRNISADRFLGLIQSRFQMHGALCSPDPIRIPFFKDVQAPRISGDLEKALLQAIQLQTGFDIANTDPATCMIDYHDIEQQLRTLIQRDSKILHEMAADIDISLMSLANAIPRHLRHLQEREHNSGESDMKSNFIKLASIDVPMENVHSELVRLAEDTPDLKQCLMNLGVMSEPTTSSKGTAANNLVQNTHVTMVHNSNATQSEIRARFDSLIGKIAPIQWQSLLWNDRVAAIAVAIPAATDDGSLIPDSTNTFKHITISVSEGSSAFESNSLPEGLERGTTNIIKFDQRRDANVIGTFSYWTDDKSSK